MEQVGVMSEWKKRKAVREKSGGSWKYYVWRSRAGGGASTQMLRKLDPGSGRIGGGDPGEILELWAQTQHYAKLLSHSTGENIRTHPYQYTWTLQSFNDHSSVDDLVCVQCSQYLFVDEGEGRFLISRHT